MLAVVLCTLHSMATWKSFFALLILFALKNIFKGTKKLQKFYLSIKTKFGHGKLFYLFQESPAGWVN
jgi:hypothetical protein